MPYAAIMVNVEDDEASSGRIKLAAHLSVRLRCALIGVAARMPRPASLSDGDVVGREAQYPIDAVDNWLEQQENSFREIASPIQQKIEWRSATDFPVDFVATQARAADLVIIAHRHVRDDSYHSLNPGAVSGVRDDLAVSPPSFPKRLQDWSKHLVSLSVEPTVYGRAVRHCHTRAAARAERQVESLIDPAPIAPAASASASTPSFWRPMLP
jgi:hypothetical protein